MGNAWRRLAAGLAAGSMILAGLAAPPAVLGVGTTIVVTTLTDPGTIGDGQCSFREAITSANTNATNTNDDCPDGTGLEDVIEFEDAGTVLLSSSLPAIMDQLTIDGGNRVTIDGQDSYTPISTLADGLEIRNIVIQDGFGAFGGAITNGGYMTIRRVTVRSSRATYGGGIHNNGTMLVYQSTIEGNIAQEAGGGIFNEDSIVLRNVTIAGNHTIDGGALFQSAGESILRHVTVSLNSSDGAAVQRANGTLSIFSSIVAGNSDGQTSGATNHESIIREESGGVLDPGGLKNNGGPTRTIRLVGGSNPALGLGAHASCSDVGFVDQRGFARPSGVTDKCDAGSVQRDRIAPTMVKSASISLRFGAALSGTSLRVRLHSWHATDGAGIGLQRFSLQKQVNGGSWTSVTTKIPVTPVVDSVKGTGSYNVSLSKDKTYRFRIRAVDWDGNVSAWRYTQTVKARLVQQTSDAVHFSTGWSTASSTKFSGGSVKYARTDGYIHSVRITFTGRAIALVTTLRAGTTLRPDMYIDGAWQGETIVEGITTTTYRAQFKSLNVSYGTHTLRILSDTTRLDIDAFAILK